MYCRIRIYRYECRIADPPHYYYSFRLFSILIDDDVAWGVMGETPPPRFRFKASGGALLFAVKKEMEKKVIYQRMRHKKLDLFHRAPFSPWIKKKKRPLTSGASVWHDYLFFFFFFLPHFLFGLEFPRLDLKHEN